MSASIVVRLNDNDLGKTATFHYHGKQRSGVVEKLGQNFFTIKLPEGADRQFSSFNYTQLQSAIVLT